MKEDTNFSKQQFVDYLEKHKIQTRSYFTGNALAHPAYWQLAEKYEDITKEFPIATYVTNNTFFLGTFIGIDEQKINYIEKIVDKFFEER